MSEASRELVVPLADGLFGVLSEPEAAGDRPMVVLINAGFVHRVGPFRVHVTLARALAAAGFPVLRFDQPSIGDAPVKTDADDTGMVRRVLDSLSAMHPGRGFVVGGLCSAADLGWKVALADERVRGLLLLDPVARPGFWFRLGQVRMLLRRPVGTWIKSLQRRLRQRRLGAARNEDYRDWPAPGAEREQLQRIVARDVDVIAVYTGGAAPYFTHERQFAANFGAAASDPRVHFEYWPECDHTFMAAEDQQRLVDAVVAWCARMD